MTYYPVVEVDLRTRRAFVFDLDGTVYLDDDLLPGADTAISRLREMGRRTLFVTNKPLELPSDYAAKLTKLGIPTDAYDVVSSTDSLLYYLRANATGACVFVVGEPLLVELVASAGFEVTDGRSKADVVVVGFDRTFDYGKLTTAFHAVRGGARLIATNPDPYCPTADGGLPDCGAILAAIETATGERAEAVVGKPSVHMVRAALDRIGVPASDAALVGDRLLTDVRMAHDSGMASVLVLSGATRREDIDGSLVPDFVIDGIGDLLPLIGGH
jgi:HAD superfamily hydrolase (TIGR01450 family)